MAELLVKAQTFTHPDPTQDAGVYKIGDVVDVQADGYVWGALEGLPRFWVFKLPGVTVEQVQKYIAEWENPDGTLTRRREWTIDINGFSQAVKDKLATVGWIIIRVPPYSGAFDVQWSTARSLFKNVKTGTTE